jgi:hypothetical protein
MWVIDETYLVYPFFGSRQMARWLRRKHHAVNSEHVQRLICLMGLKITDHEPNLAQ